MNADGLFLFAYWLLSGLRKRLMRPPNARTYSNRLLRDYLKGLGGDIVNVSGWQDSDKGGRRYRDYDDHVNSCTITNIVGQRGMLTEPVWVS